MRTHSAEEGIFDLIGYQPVAAIDLIERYRMSLKLSTVSQHLTPLCMAGTLTP